MARRSRTLNAAIEAARELWKAADAVEKIKARANEREKGLQRAISLRRGGETEPDESTAPLE